MRGGGWGIWLTFHPSLSLHSTRTHRVCKHAQTQRTDPLYRSGETKQATRVWCYYVGHRSFILLRNTKWAAWVMSCDPDYLQNGAPTKEDLLLIGCAYVNVPVRVQTSTSLGEVGSTPNFWVWASKRWINSSPMQVFWCLMWSSGIDFQTHKTFSGKFVFAECTSLRCIKQRFFQDSFGFFGVVSKLREKSKTVECFGRQCCKLLYNWFAHDFAFVSDCCRGMTFICMQAYVFWHLCRVSGGMSSSIL